MIRLCAFADEAATSLSEQIAALKENGISLIEVRGIDGKNVAQLTKKEARHYAELLHDNGIGVFSIGSPLGKVPLGEADAHMDTVRHVCELARIFGADRIRIFSFYESDGRGSEVIDALRRMTEIAAEYGVVLCHENEKAIYGDTPARVAELMAAGLQGLRFVFDPANYVQCGVNAKEALTRFFAHTDYFHIKDVIAATGELVPSGYGDAAIDAIVAAVAASGRDVVFTLEPHLAVFDGYAQIDREEMKHRFTFESTKESFAAAANALKDVLRAAGFCETEQHNNEKGWCLV